MSDDANRREDPTEGHNEFESFDAEFDESTPPADIDLDNPPTDPEENGLYEEPDVILTDEEIAALSEGAELPGGLPWPIIIGGVLILLLLILLASRLRASRGQTPSPPPASPTPIRTVQPTFTPTPSLQAPGVGPEATTTPTPLPRPPTPTPAPPAGEGGFTIGQRVRIVGTEAEGVRFRTGPGKEYVTLAILFDGTELEVVGGPEESGGFTWWRVQDKDGTIGWIIADVLEPVR